MAERSTRVQVAIQQFVSQVVEVAREEAARVVQETLLQGPRGGVATSISTSQRSEQRPRPLAKGESLKRELLKALRSGGGQRVGALGHQLGAKTKDLAPAIKSLLAEKAIRKTGSRRTTTYFASE